MYRWNIASYNSRRDLWVIAHYIIDTMIIRMIWSIRILGISCKSCNSIHTNFRNFSKTMILLNHESNPNLRNVRQLGKLLTSEFQGFSANHRNKDIRIIGISGISGKTSNMNIRMILLSASIPACSFRIFFDCGDCRGLGVWECRVRAL